VRDFCKLVSGRMLGACYSMRVAAMRIHSSQPENISQQLDRIPRLYFSPLRIHSLFGSILEALSARSEFKNSEQSSNQKALGNTSLGYIRIVPSHLCYSTPHRGKESTRMSPGLSPYLVLDASTLLLASYLMFRFLSGSSVLGHGRLHARQCKLNARR
jgi:hypothetical protein